MAVLFGPISKITFFNEETGFGIVKIKLDYKHKDLLPYRNILFSNQVNVLSAFDRKPLIDEEYEFHGEIETSQYGMQLRAKTFRRINEQSKEGIITYLSSDYFPGIGRVTAEKIYQKLGSDSLNKIADDKSNLDDIVLSSKQKETIYENVVTNMKNEKQIVDLLNLGLTMKMAVRISKELGLEAIKEIKKNPYQLINLIEGIGFLRADHIAKNIGIVQDDPIRIQALIRYALSQLLFRTGNTYVEQGELFQEILRILGEENDFFNRDLFARELDNLQIQQQIIMEHQDIFDYPIYHQEKFIAQKLISILEHGTSHVQAEEIDEKINEVMRLNRIDYKPKQLEAIKKALTQSITIITGGPGTGKSTIIKGIMDTYVSCFRSEAAASQIALAAPTGRASKRLRELTKYPAVTLHKLLGYDGGNRFNALQEPPLEYNMIIIDEFSMVDLSLFHVLLSCMKDETVLVLVGDADQLPSVMPGNILKDLIDSKEISTVRLDIIHRQTDGSSITMLAHHINSGEMPYNLADFQPACQFYHCQDTEILPLLEEKLVNALADGLDLIKDIQVLVPLYRGDLGIDKINFRLQDRFNPLAEEINYLGKRFRVNDKVLQLINRHEKQVMNGDIGTIISLSYQEEKFIGLDVLFDFGSVHYEKDEMEDLSLAYAVSIHKAQGSEFPMAIIPFSFKYYGMLKRKLIYTAITRAKSQVIMLGNEDALRKGIVELEENRKTKLVDRIQSIFLGISEEEGKKELTPYDFL